MWLLLIQQIDARPAHKRMNLVNSEAIARVIAGESGSTICMVDGNDFDVIESIGEISAKLKREE